MDSVIAVTGRRSTIVRALEARAKIERLEGERLPVGCYRFVLAAGVLVGKTASEHSPLEAYETFNVNAIQPIRLCERILRQVPNARICVVGSVSGIRGSFDEFYAASKAALHHYVKTRKVAAGQQLVAVAPIIIADSGMTQRRGDYPQVLEQRETVTAAEVAGIIYHLLMGDVIENNRIIPVGEC